MNTDIYLLANEINILIAKHTIKNINAYENDYYFVWVINGEISNVKNFHYYCYRNNFYNAQIGDKICNFFNVKKKGHVIDADIAVSIVDKMNNLVTIVTEHFVIVNDEIFDKTIFKNSCNDVGLNNFKSKLLANGCSSDLVDLIVKTNKLAFEKNDSELCLKDGIVHKIWCDGTRTIEKIFMVGEIYLILNNLYFHITLGNVPALFFLK